MTNELIDSVLQVLAFSLIPFLVYLIAKKKVKGFFDYIGLKKSTARANVFAVLNTLVFLAPTLTLAFFNEAFKQILTDPGTITGQFRAMGFSIPTLIMILIVALAKTSLSEEIFFRGFDAVHGQDIEFWVGGAPVNEVSNVHGQGYADLHFVMPEVVTRVTALPGPYSPEQGDFA
nr:hypothetical protein [Flavilitoribacter sp.]